MMPTLSSLVAPVACPHYGGFSLITLHRRQAITPTQSMPRADLEGGAPGAPQIFQMNFSIQYCIRGLKFVIKLISKYILIEIHILWKLFLKSPPPPHPCYGPLCKRGFNGDRWIPHKGQWRWALMFSLIWTNGCANHRDSGGLRRHRAHYDATVMNIICLQRIAQATWQRLFRGDRVGNKMVWLHGRSRGRRRESGQGGAASTWEDICWWNMAGRAAMWRKH